MASIGLPRSRGVRVALAVLAAIILLVVVDVIVLSSRMNETDVAMPEADDDLQTWVIVGSDSRAQLPDGASQDQFGTADDVPDARADLILLLVESDDGARLVSIPRDLLVTVDGFPMRLGMTLLDGAQALVDTLCTSFAVPADHYVQVDFAGFADVVDAVGGIEIDLPSPLRDPVAGLQIEKAGTQTVDGATALALVRSRNAEELVDGTWTPTTAGVDDRTSWGGLVLHALASKAADQWWNPVALQSLAWSLTGALTVDDGTGVFDLIGLDRDIGEVTELPHDPPQIEPQPGQAVPLPPNEQTGDVLAGLGFGDACTPA